MSKKDNKGLKAATLKSIKAVADKLGKRPNHSEYDRHRAKDSLSEYGMRYHGWTYKQLADEALGEYKRESKAKSLEVIERDGKGGRGKRYFVTACIPGMPVHYKFLESIRQFLKAEHAELIVLPMKGTHKKAGFELDHELRQFFYTSFQFNSNLIAQDFGISPKQINPLTGLKRLGQKEWSVIVASPKQQLESVATSNAKMPHIMLSTGAINVPFYGRSKTDLLATQDHVVGGLIVEIQDAKLFFVRQVQADTNGHFYDLDSLYTPQGRKSHKDTEALILGDLHAGEHAASAINTWDEVIEIVEPKRVVLHDVFSGQSVNHHEDNNITAKSTRNFMATTLQKELAYTGHLLMELRKKWINQKFVIVASNHDEFLNRYLSEGRYLKDPHNYRLALDLAAALCDGHNPVQFAIERDLKIKLTNCVWLKRDDDYKIAGVQLGAHGDLGPNGSRGSIANIETAYGSAIVGHSHSPGILRRVWQVGTSTLLKLRYNRGPSSWLHASCILFSNGQRQMIISVQGKWRLKITR
jgi:hypothetical protein